MRTGIFDLETSNLSVNFGILLCCTVKEYGKRQLVTVRADGYDTWKHHKTDQRDMVKDTLQLLNQFDILVAHNGQRFDKRWLNTLALKYKQPPSTRWKKFIDPVMLSRNHLRLGSNKLSTLIDYFDIEEHKTDLKGDIWLRAALEGDKEAMDYIVEHCEKDVRTLEKVYDIVRPLVEKIDNRGSAF